MNPDTKKTIVTVVAAVLIFVEMVIFAELLAKHDASLAFLHVGAIVLCWPGIRDYYKKLTQ